MDMVLTSKEEAVAHWKAGETFFLFLGEFKHVGKDVDGGGTLLEE